MIQELDLKNTSAFGDSSCKPQVGLTWRWIARYAACGISGAMPYPVLRRMDETFPLAKRCPARHKKSDILVLEITPKILSAVPFKMTVAKVRLAMAAMGKPKSKVADMP